ncbi:hypothetical protein FHS85_002732 [Rhodoligotrophos appendicifer]|uniref:hypothetical protein n=1 Tax=Rhodoligotrophos appendicifer TaxID=987056 RepID=UPI00118485CE|nr:hypothetical protein [Rhodoligotrophos appendicifer]
MPKHPWPSDRRRAARIDPSPQDSEFYRVSRMAARSRQLHGRGIMLFHAAFTVLTVVLLGGAGIALA